MTFSERPLEDLYQWSENHMRVLDCRQYPKYSIYLTFTRSQEVAHAIKSGIIKHPEAQRRACLASIFLAAQRKSDTSDWKQALKADFEVLRKATDGSVDIRHSLDQAQALVLDTNADKQESEMLLRALNRLHLDNP